MAPPHGILLKWWCIFQLTFFPKQRPLALSWLQAGFKLIRMVMNIIHSRSVRYAFQYISTVQTVTLTGSSDFHVSILGLRLSAWRNKTFPF
jgi:hypothetical protein